MKKNKTEKKGTGWQFMPFKSLVVGCIRISPSIPEKPSIKGVIDE